jgi:hypothetical protein
MLLTMELWQVAQRRRPFAYRAPVVTVQSVQKDGEPIFVNVWRAGVTKIVAKVKYKLHRF